MPAYTRTLHTTTNNKVQTRARVGARIQSVRIPIAIPPIFILLSSISALVLCCSYAAEFLFHLKACKLCQWQRAVYFLVIAGSLPAFFTQHKAAILRVLQGCLILGIFIASYHSAVIFGLIDDPCQVTPKLNDLASFKAALDQSVPCSASSWKLFHMPISIFNAALSTTLVAVIQTALRKLKREKLPA
jgi:disulfide bond formation protein DsbB